MVDDHIAILLNVEYPNESWAIFNWISDYISARKPVAFAAVEPVWISFKCIQDRNQGFINALVAANLFSSIVTIF